MKTILLTRDSYVLTQKYSIEEKTMTTYQE